MASNKNRVLALVLGAGLVFTGAVAIQAAGDKDQKGAAAMKKGAATEDVFYIYKDRGSRLNHYIPSGWMGDYGDIKMNQGWTAGMGGDKKDAPADKKGAKAPAKGKGAAADSSASATTNVDTQIQIRYTAERKQGAGWAGIYWQHPANNWGDKKGGFDLSAYKKMKFRARGENGGEVIDKFFIGGITGQTEEGDTDEASLATVELTKDMKEYEIDLNGLDLSHIIGGFGVAANADANPNGFTIYLDDVRLEK
jgi:hypothetical protein